MSDSGRVPKGRRPRRSAATWVARVIAWVAIAVFVLVVLLIFLFSRSNLTF